MSWKPSLEDVLLAYSEWLDADCGLVRSDCESGDNRTHEEVVHDNDTESR